MEIFEYLNKELGTNYKSDKDIKWPVITTNYNLSEELIEKIYNEDNWWVNYSTLKDGACAKGINPFARLID